MFLVFNFDGTGNEPQDGRQEENKQGKKEDDNISNILKLHLMFGGNLYKKGQNYGKPINGNTSHIFYYQGVGTYGTWWSKLINSGISPEKGDVKSILRKALNDFNDVYQPGATVLVTGFSRGAALARRFISQLESNSPRLNNSTDPFVFLVAFDTVASIGLPNMSSSERPDYDVLFEKGFTLSRLVKKATHLLSLDDKRKAFQPTLMNYDAERISEIWFAGAHSDVGGGYYRDGLSDVTLNFAINWLEQQSQEDILPQVELNIPSSEQINDACPDKMKNMIGFDDLARNPNPLGKNHQQDRWPVIDWLTLDDRVFCVIENNQISKDKAPTLHNSVPIRINKDANYKPKSLLNVKHKVWYNFNESISSVGVDKHVEFARQNWKKLTLNTPITTTVYAAEKFNHTGILLKKGQSYKIEVSKEQKWHDGNIPCKANGWNRDDVKLGLSELPIKFAESLRRVPDADWFTLCVCTDTKDSNATPIGYSGIFKVKSPGELILFANDLDSKYGNNRGHLSVEITLTKEPN